jgi:hypothetical protein
MVKLFFLANHTLDLIRNHSLRFKLFVIVDFLSQHLTFCFIETNYAYSLCPEM